MSPELLLHGATFHDMLGGGPAEAMAVRDGRIMAIGRLAAVEAAIGSSARRIHLDGSTVVPGFDDAHVHVWKVGQLRTSILDLRGMDALEAVYSAVTDRAKVMPRGSWLLGRGWSEAALEGSPERGGLDRAAPDHPVLLTRTCAHVHAANSAALRLAGIDATTSAPAGGALDLERGLLFETAHGLVQRVLPPPTRADIEEWILAGARHLAAEGITSACDAAVDTATWEAYRSLEQERRLPIRMSLLHLLRADIDGAPIALPPPRASAWLRCDTGKLFADGALSAGTAALSIPHRDGTTGILRLDADGIEDFGRRAASAGYSVATHAIGDRAIEATLTAYGRLRRAGDLRAGSRIEHFGLPTPAHISEACGLGVRVVTQPIFRRALAASFARVLPGPLAAGCYPLRAFHDAGLAVAYSSDAPVVREVSPLAGIGAAMEAGVPARAALSAYTRGADDDDDAGRGTLAVGARADAVVLDADPLQANAADIVRIRVRGTLIDGRFSGEHA